MLTHVWESSIIPYPLDDVWALVKYLDFSRYNKAGVTSVVMDDGANWEDVGGIRTVVYSDKEKTTQKLKLTELSELHYVVQWDLEHTSHDHHVAAASYKLKLRRVSSNSTTFIEWGVDFSNDASKAVLIDAKYKARDHFKDITKTLRANAKSAAKKKLDAPALIRQVSSKTQQLQEAFGNLDKNKNGILEPEEFYVAVNKLFGKDLPKQALELILMEADLDQSGTIDYKEFVKFLEVSNDTSSSSASSSASKK